MVIESSCAKLNASINKNVLDFGSHRLGMVGAKIQLIDSRTNKILLISSVDSDNCVFRFTYDANSNEAIFFIDDVAQDEYFFTSSEKIFVDRLLLPIGEKPSITQLEITTRPNFSEGSYVRSLFLIVSVLLIALSLSLNKKFVSRGAIP